MVRLMFLDLRSDPRDKRCCGSAAFARLERIYIDRRFRNDAERLEKLSSFTRR